MTESNYVLQIENDCISSIHSLILQKLEHSCLPDKKCNPMFVALDKEAQKASDNEKRAVTLKRELDDFKQKSKKQKVNQNDVRLQRALAEVCKDLFLRAFPS